MRLESGPFGRRQTIVSNEIVHAIFAIRPAADQSRDDVGPGLAVTLGTPLADSS